MATIPITLYNRFRATDSTGQGGNQNRFLAGPNGGVPGQPFGPGNAGDTAAISLFFLDPLNGDTAFQYHRYAGSDVEVNLYAQGNNHFYGIVHSTTEIVPTTGITVTRTGTGSDTALEKQRIVFNGTPGGGTWRLFIQRGSGNNFPAGPHDRADLACDLTLPYNITADELGAQLRALLTYNAYNTNGNPQASGQNVGLSYWRYWGYGTTRDPIVTAITGGFEIQFGTLDGANNTWLHGIPLIQAQDGNILYRYGYTINVPLTDPNFVDLFKAANAPAYLDVVLRSPAVLGDNGVMGGPRLSGQLRLVVSDSGIVPTADFTSDLTAGVAPVAVQFSDLSTNSPTSWAWNFGDGSTSTSRNPSHTYTAAGTYTVTLVATNGTGSSAPCIKAAYIIITGPPVPPPSGFGDCSGGLGVNPALPCSYFDGNYAELTEVGFARREMVDGHPFLELWHQLFEVRSGSFVRAEVGTPGGIGGRIVKDTIWSPQGSDIIQFERISHNVPGDRVTPIWIDKNFIGVIYTLSGATIVDASIMSWVDGVAATCFWHYFMEGTTQILPSKPILQIIPLIGGSIGGTRELSDFGTGFPKVGNFFANNATPSFITGGSELVIGKLWVRKIIIG